MGLSRTVMDCCSRLILITSEVLYQLSYVGVSGHSTPRCSAQGRGQSRSLPGYGPRMSERPAHGEALSGGCLCGGVRFEITGPFTRANHCHCSRCRKHSGTFGETQGRVRREDFRLLRGEELIRVFRPENGAVKAFCSVCGASLFGGSWPEGQEVSVRFGALEGDPGTHPQYHTFVGSKASWDILPEDGLPRFEAANPEANASART